VDGDAVSQPGTHLVPDGGDYDAYVREYAAAVDQREEGGVDGDPFGILPGLLDLLGDVAGQRVLDAGSGTGYLARVLAARGARVTGVDVSPRLVAAARERDPAGAIDYRAADLSQPWPQAAESFDAVASYLVLNDVPDYRGFAATLAAVLAPGGRLVVALNNPYGAVVHSHVTDYFDSGAVSVYRGFLPLGIRVYHYHRTLEDYLDAFLGAGLRLGKLADLTGLAGERRPQTCLPEGARFPRFMLLGFTKAQAGAGDAAG
jgi:2-polyprenyl-3-methyl-5-hydroxy-6-metoxy-1,4-benzoquinol methylase